MVVMVMVVGGVRRRLERRKVERKRKSRRGKGERRETTKGRECIRSRSTQIPFGQASGGGGTSQ